MTPMEAWSIISANLNHLYKIRRTDNHGRPINYKGYEPADTEAEVMCFRALKEMEERMKSNADS